MLALLWKRSFVLFLSLPVERDVVGTNRLYDLLFLRRHRRVEQFVRWFSFSTPFSFYRFLEVLLEDEGGGSCAKSYLSCASSASSDIKRCC